MGSSNGTGSQDPLRAIHDELASYGLLPDGSRVPVEMLIQSTYRIFCNRPLATVGVTAVKTVLLDIQRQIAKDYRRHNGE